MVHSDLCAQMGRNGCQSVETVWALKDVSFEVQRGEVAGAPAGTGAIGRDSAGSIGPHLVRQQRWVN